MQPNKPLWHAVFDSPRKMLLAVIWQARWARERCQHRRGGTWGSEALVWVLAKPDRLDAVRVPSGNAARLRETRFRLPIHSTMVHHD